MAKQNVTVSIDTDNQFFVENQPTPEAELQSAIYNYTANIQDGTIKLHADKTVPIQYVVVVIDAVNKINAQTGQSHRVILATEANK